MTAIALLFDGELESSAAQFEMAMGLPGAQYRIWKHYVLGGLALVRALTGQCVEARSLATEAIDFAEANQIGHHHSLAFAHLALAQVALDQCLLDEATYHLHESHVRAQRTGRSAFLGLQRVCTSTDSRSPGDRRLRCRNYGPRVDASRNRRWSSNSRTLKKSVSS